MASTVTRSAIFRPRYASELSGSERPPLRPPAQRMGRALIDERSAVRIKCGERGEIDDILNFGVELRDLDRRA